MSEPCRPVALGPVERSVYERMVRVAPAAAQMFFDAANMVAAEHPIPSSAMLAAHLVREIESSLTGLLDPLGGARIQGEKDGQQAKLNRIVADLAIPEDEPWLKAMRDRTSEGTRPVDWVHRSGLDRLRSTDETFDQLWRTHVMVFDALLDLFERRAALILARIELIASGVPTVRQAETLASLVPRDSVSMRTLFDNCREPEWLPELRKAGFFDSPPEGVIDTDTGEVRFLGWPAGDYLLQMAEHPDLHDEIAAILRELPASENPYVHSRVVEVALKLPADNDAELVDLFLHAITLGQRLPLASELGQLVARLAEGGCVAEAFLLARPLLQVQRQQDSLSARVSSPTYSDWEYAEAARHVMPALATSAPLPAIEFVTELLAKAVSLTLSSPDSDWDGSEYWRAKIDAGEDDDDDHERDPRNALVVATRDTLSSAVVGGYVELREIVDSLFGRRRTVFSRLALHLLTRHAKLEPELAASYAFDQGNWEKSEWHYEMARLLCAAFPLVSEETAAEYLAGVKHGPDLADWLDRFRDWKHREPTDEETSAHVRAWKLERLYPISEHLTGVELDEFRVMVAESEKPPSWDDYAVFRVRTEWGDKPPLDAAALAALAVEDMVTYLGDWEPEEEGVFGSSVRGLSRELQRAVEENPARFAQESGRFLDMRQEYVDAIIQGLEQALRQNHAFEWSPAVSMLKACTVDRRYDFSGSERGEGDQTLKAAASLLEAGLKSSSNPIPSSLLDEAWVVLRPVFDDPNPTPEHEAEFGGSNMDPFTLSINTVRGEATHALLGLLMAKGRESGEFELPLNDRSGVRRWPELQQILERLLDPLIEPSLAVRAAIGSYLGGLALLDPGWFRDAMPSLFPPADPPRRFVVFDSYLLWGRMFAPAIEVLRSEYLYRVAQLGEEPPVVWEKREPEQALARHLVTQYLYGTIELDDGLLAMLYTPANHEQWDTATTHVAKLIQGRRESQEELEPAFLERAQRLFEWRLKAATMASNHADLDRHRDEMVDFGYWVVSGAFSESWWLDELQRVIALVHWIEPDSLVIRKLADAAVRAPTTAVELATEVVLNDPYGYSILGYRDDLKTIVSAAVGSEDPTAVSSGRDLANRLVAKGIEGFRELADG